MPGTAIVTAMAFLQLTAIIVEDYDEAIAFFTHALGFELTEDSPAHINDCRLKRWVVVRPRAHRPAFSSPAPTANTKRPRSATSTPATAGTFSAPPPFPQPDWSAASDDDCWWAPRVSVATVAANAST
jgi:catechol 2,3-dioxygenase-like lactoylglutathione lyase family enzyme